MLVFSNFLHGARKPHEIVNERAAFFGNNLFWKTELGIWVKNRVF